MKFDPTAKVVKKATRGKDDFVLTECEGYTVFNLWQMVPAPSAEERQAWEDEGIEDNRHSWVNRNKKSRLDYILYNAYNDFKLESFECRETIINADGTSISNHKHIVVSFA